MAYDIDHTYRRKCFCGNGEFIVEIYTPDHPYRTRSKSIESQITCEVCRALYSIHTLHNEIGIARLSDLATQKQLEAEQLKKERNFLNDPAIESIFRQLQSELATKRSVAQIHRWLRSVNLTLDSESTFRKKWLGAAEWVQGNRHIWQVKKIMDLLEFRNEFIEKKLQEIEHSSQFRVSVQFVGPAICSLE